MGKTLTKTSFVQADITDRMATGAASGSTATGEDRFGLLSLAQDIPRLKKRDGQKGNIRKFTDRIRRPFDMVAELPICRIFQVLHPK